MQEPNVPVTGVARGGLGTATNLDDTQVYSLDDLREPSADPVEAAPASAPRAEAAPLPPWLEAEYEAERKPEPLPIAIPVEPRRINTAARAQRPVGKSSRTKRPVGPIVVGALAALGLAAILTLRDAPPAGPGGLGGGVTGAGSSAGTFAPFATTAPAPTAAPEGGGNGKGKGNGKGNGKN